MATILSDQALDRVIRGARTHRHWQADGKVTPVLLEAVYDLLKMAPTSGNCSPGRFVFVVSKEAKERLKPALDSGNVRQTMEAPATAIVAYDTEFYERMSKLSPHNDARSWFVGKPKLIEETAFRNGSLQGAYLILAARARTRLRTDVGLRSQEGRCRFFP